MGIRLGVAVLLRDRSADVVREIVLAFRFAFAILQSPKRNTQAGENEMTSSHTAWRFLGNQVAYVQENNCKQGDKYSYTSDVNKALEMTEGQCRRFCKYMYECDSVGFWN